MLEHLNELRELFFKWCDETVISQMMQEGTILKQWRPRRSENGGYELTYELKLPDGTTAAAAVPIPDRFKELLDKEFFEDD
ncbi:MAG: hypothetical protein QMC81_00020 [Thermoanaerobacterales bacterium]|nr:hypothetical protein [Bacillota bacterium]MDI6905862.1 hypothetical protein [Thermoanaerobacterales bacterium]